MAYVNTVHTCFFLYTESAFQATLRRPDSAMSASMTCGR